MIDLGPIRVLGWFPERRGASMLGWFDIEWGPLLLRCLTLHRNDAGGYGIGLPEKWLEGRFIQVVDFCGREQRHEFRALVLEALLAFFEEHNLVAPDTRREAPCA